VSRSTKVVTMTQGAQQLVRLADHDCAQDGHARVAAEEQVGYQAQGAGHRTAALAGPRTAGGQNRAPTSSTAAR